METCLVLLSSLSGISTFSGDMELDRLGVFLSLYIRRSLGRLWDQSGDQEFSRDIDREIVRASEGLNGRLLRRRLWFGWSCLGFAFWELYWSGVCLGDWEFDRDTRISMDWGFSGIWTCWEIIWEINQKIVLDKGLVSVASPLGFDRGIVTIQIYTIFEYSSPSYKISY